MVYMSKVSDAASADGSSGWFKIFQNGWAKKSGSAVGDDDFWGNKDLNNCCGRMEVKIPSDIAPGDYLLRAETIALHASGGSGGAQFYLTCYQLTVTGGGSASPATVSFPGAYKASDPGILVNIHSSMSGYTVPGPAVYAGGENRTPGGTCKIGSGPSSTAQLPSSTTSATTPATSSPAPGGGGNPGCTAERYQQCGGNGYTGCTNCAVS
jgi:cellulase